MRINLRSRLKTSTFTFDYSFISAGKGATVYDVIINPEFFARLHKSQLLMSFFLTVVLNGISYKYDVTLDRSKEIKITCS